MIIADNTKFEPDWHWRNCNVETLQEVSTVSKYIIVYIPTKDEFISKIKLKSRNRWLDGEYLLPHGNKTNMYIKYITLPKSEFNAVLYAYEVTTCKYFDLRFTKIEVSTKTVETNSFILNEYAVQRDIIKGAEGECIINHIEDILFWSGVDRDLESIQKCIHEIDILLYRRKETYSTKDFQDLMGKLLSLPDFKTIKAKVLLLVVSGNLLRDMSQLKKVYGLNADVAISLLEALKSFTLNDLPHSCHGYMPQACLILCEIYLQKRYCLLRFMDMCYPFLKPGHFNSIVSTKFHNGKIELVGEKSSDLIKVAQRLCAELYLIHVSDDNALPLLKRLLFHLPIEFVLQIGTDLRKQDKSELFEDLHITIINSIKAEIMKGKRKSNLQHMLYLWDKVHANIELPQDVINLFEEEILEIVRCCKGTDIMNKVKDLEKLVFGTHVFNCPKIQLKLMETFAGSAVYPIHKLFIECIKTDKFAGVLKENLKDLCLIWLKKSIGTHKAEYKCSDICAPYLALSKLLAAELVSADMKVCQVLLEEVFIQLQRQDLFSIFRKLDYEMEGILGQHILEIVKNHIVEILKRKHHTRKPEEVLSYVCTQGKLRVNSRTTTSIVCFMLDDILRVTDLEGEVEVFSHIVNQSACWKIVLKGHGKYIDKVQNNKTYKMAEQCVKRVSQDLKRGQVTYQFLNTFDQKNKRDNAFEILKVVSPEFYEKIWSRNKDVFEQQLNEIALVKSVLTEIHVYVLGENLPVGFHEQWNCILEFEKSVHHRLSAEEIRNGAVPAEIADLLSSSKLLANIVHSKVFWNIGLPVILADFEKKAIDNQKDDDILECIPMLFERDDGDDGKMPIMGNSSVASFLDVVLESGGNTFKYQWDALMKDPEFSMAQWSCMFKDTDYIKEIEMAEIYLGAKVKDQIKMTLYRLDHLNAFKRSVEAIKQSLKSCKIDDSGFFEAAESFEHLITGDCSSYSFFYVGQSLQKVFEIAEPLQEDTILVLEAVGNASNLLDFLFKIIDEDIRNLIDAVEDISEQHVQETSVAALIEVKRFLQPVLKTDLNAAGLFDVINKQVKSNTTVGSTLPFKIEDCMNNLHNLISLYNNVANRSEQTKEVIVNIVKKGTFQFALNEQGSNCDCKASYTAKKVKTTHSKSTLIDLRSRALLLSNKYESKSGIKELELFIAYIDTCADIVELVQMLHASGHIKYKVFNKAEEASSLTSLKDHLDGEHFEWCAHLDSIRNEYYVVNFLHGFQIHVLHTYLETNVKPEQIAKCEIEAKTLLKIIHPDFQLQTLKEHYLCIKPDLKRCDDYAFLEYIGRSLHESLKSFSFFQRCLKGDLNKSRKLGDIVQRGRLLVAQLDDSSLLVVRTILSLYCNTLQRLPEPNQVLLCSKQTKWSEIDLLLRRCLGAFSFYGKEVLYCIANVELLPNEIQFKLVEALRNIEPTYNFFFAVVCRGSKNHPFIDELSEFVCKVRPLSDMVIEKILQSECPNVTTVTSEVAGLGKTTRVVKQAYLCGHSVASLHISGPMTKERIVNGLMSLEIKEFQTLHIDIGCLASTSELDTFLFELVVLRFVSTGKTSVYLPTSFVSIEIANSLQDSLRNSLQTAILFKREHISWQNYDNLVVSKEVNSPIQVVCHFLFNLGKASLDTLDIFFTGPQCTKPLSTEACRQILQKYFPTFPGISFSIVNIFLNVLADQLKKMSSSSFFRTSRIKDMVGYKTVPNVRSSLVKALVDVSKEFSSRSVDACRSTQLSTVDLSSISGESNTAAGATKRVESMIRWEESNHLMYIFHNQNIQTISPIYRDKSKVPGHIKSLFESQMKKEMQDYKKMNQTELQVVLQKICRSNPLMLQQETLCALSKDYALTPDNLLKMILIILRIKAGIPVLVMGETGCGKTSLIRYLANICEIKFEVLNIHAGVEEEKIVDKVLQCNSEAVSHMDDEYWLFFDEINTSEYVGLISDIICHHSFLGQILAPNLVVMGACNPYKLRSARAISTAGLKGKVRTDELSRLVYRVLPLPEMLVDYVWDFGSLNESDEKLYIHRMVEEVFPDNGNYHKALVDLLSMSQSFVRDNEDATCSVSLRDVRRCQLLTIWFQKILPQKKMKQYPIYQRFDDKERAIILALAHCYHSRIPTLQLRKEYRERIAKVFWKNNIYMFESDINGVIKCEQEDILNRMDLPPGTAKNIALRENVFVLLVSILNRIPIFVVGKPGCSKSLSMQVIRNNLRGADSKDPFFKKLPQLYCVAFQGSESSTSDGIIKVFEKAERYQETNHADSVLSVVILDEIGLAEISRFNPLKVLHNLLEPDGKDRPNVAVVGISNWSLDASKMNRAIHLSRPEMDEQELFETGKSISDSFVRDETASESWLLNQTSHTKLMPPFKTVLIESNLEHIAYSYFSYVRKLTFQYFHGLRDFYSLVKFFAKEVSVEPQVTDQEKKEIMLMGLERNFGGLPDERQTLLSEFKFEDLKRPCPVINLIKSNVVDPLARHLMLITSGESVLGILEQNLISIGRESREIIFGSQFEEDLTDDYNYRILNRIILCMEQGLVLILKDLENIYGSLYDMLNQNYTIIGKKKNCRVALGAYSNPICHVAESFRCIVLVDDSKKKHSDPPFLNRFEKQYLRFVDIISPEQSNFITKLEDWIQNISVCNDFDKYDAFPIYSEDMVSSLVLKNFTNGSKEEDIIRQCKADLLWVFRPEVIVRLAKNECEEVLYEAEEITNTYLSLPLHKGIHHLLESQLCAKGDVETLDSLMTVVFTNSNIHTKVLFDINSFRVQVEKLGAFKSEKQLSSRLQLFWLESNSDILFLQCSAVDDERHIMLAKSVIEKMRHEFLSLAEDTRKKHVYLIVHLDSSKGASSILSQINFLSNWKLVTLDSLEEPTVALPELYTQSLHDALVSKKPLDNYISEQLFWAFTRIKYSRDGRDVTNLANIMATIRNTPEFLRVLEQLIMSWITKHYPDIDDRKWQIRVACDRQAIQTASSFIDALDGYILEIISAPLVKYLYVMEDQSMIDTFFVEDEHSTERRDIWTRLALNEELFSISELPNYSGPESYICNSFAMTLKMPFSAHVFLSVETTAEEYLDSVKILKSKCGLDPDNELPEEILFELQKKQELIIDQKLPRLMQLSYKSALGDYVDDFCNIMSTKICPMLVENERMKCMKLVLFEKVSLSGKDLAEGIASLHIAFWNNAQVFRTYLQLFQKCRDLFTEEDLQKINLGEIEMGEHTDDITESVEEITFESVEEKNIYHEELVSEANGNTDNDILAPSQIKIEEKEKTSVELSLHYNISSKFSGGTETANFTLDRPTSCDKEWFDEGNLALLPKVANMEEDENTSVILTQENEHSSKLVHSVDIAYCLKQKENNLDSESSACTKLENTEEIDTFFPLEEDAFESNTSINHLNMELSADGINETDEMQMENKGNQVFPEVPFLKIIAEETMTSDQKLTDSSFFEMDKDAKDFKDTAECLDEENQILNDEKNRKTGPNVKVECGEELTTVKESDNVPSYNSSHTDIDDPQAKQFDGQCTELIFEAQGGEESKVFPSSKISVSYDTVDFDTKETTFVCMDQSERNNNEFEHLETYSRNFRTHIDYEKSSVDSKERISDNLSSTEEIDKDDDTDLKCILTQLVCEKMLPTFDVIEHCKGIDQWHVKVNDMLILIAQLHPDSRYIHKLRISSDIVTTLVIPHKLDQTLLHNFADTIQTEDSLDSPLVYKALLNIIEKVPSGSTASSQRLLANYFFRCLLIYPESDSILNFIEFIFSDKLVTNNLAAFKPVLCLAMEYEQEDDENFLNVILNKGVSGVCETSSINSRDDTEEQDFMHNKSFLIGLDNALLNLGNAGKSQCPFLVMLVDVIEDTFRRSIGEIEPESEAFSGLLGNLICSQKTISEDKFDLQSVVAIGFFKACMKFLISDGHFENERTKEYINAVMSKPTENEFAYTIETCIMKIIAFEMRSSTLKKWIESLKSVIPNFDNLHLPVNDSLPDHSIDRCPLVNYLTPAKQKEFSLLMKDIESDSPTHALDLISEVKTRDEGFLLLFAYAEMMFYVPKSYAVLNDRFKSHATTISLDAKKKASLSKTEMYFLQCLLGVEDFRITHLTHSEQSTSGDCLLNSVLVSLFSLCIIHSECESDQSFFIDSFHSPTTLGSCYIPGYPSEDGQNVSFLKTQKFAVGTFAICECRHRIAILSDFSDQTCPVCAKYLHTIVKVETEGNNVKECNGFTKGTTTDPLYVTRNLSPLACQTLLFLIKGCLIGSLAVNKTVPDQLDKLLHLPAIDIPQLLWKDIQVHLENIGKLLGVGERSVALFLQVVLHHMKDLMFSERVQMKTALDRMAWEQKFNLKMQEVVDNRFTLQKNMMINYRFMLGKNELEDSLLEIDDIKDKSLSSVFRLKNIPSYDNFMSELYFKSDRFPLLSLVIGWKEELQLPVHIKPIVQWHMAVVSTVNYTMRKHDFLNLKVTDFIQQTGDKAQTEVLRTRFGHMKESWAYLRKHLTSEISEEMIPMHFDLKLEKCSIYTKDCVLYRVLEMLVQIQNDILDNILMLADKCESVCFVKKSEMQSVMPLVHVADVTQVHLLQLTDNVFKWDEVIEDNSLCDISYGQGQRVWYDFPAIEKLIGQRLIPGKAYIQANYEDIPRIIFTDELYKNYVSLSNDIKSKVNQKPLSSDVLRAVDEKHKSDRRITRDLLIQIGMIMTLLNKTGGDPDKCLIDYVEENKNVLTKKFSEDLLPSPQTAMKLCHIVALYERLEELNAESIIDALGDEFQEELDFDQKNVFESLIKRNRKLGDYVLKACKRFVNRCLSLREADAALPLLDYLDDGSFWTEGVYIGSMLRAGEIEERLEDVIPKAVMVNNIYHLVTLIETELEKQRQESNQMSKLAAT